MAFWGMDLTQSDEFCEVYEEYMDWYDAGFDPPVITCSMLEKYLKVFGTPSKIPHNIVFAIAKAEWTLGFRSEGIFSRVNEIIETDENIAYYDSLGFSEAELAERKKKLLNFQSLLSTPNKRIKKRRISPYNQVKRLPKGTVSYYECDGGYYGFVVLDSVYDGRLLTVTEKLSARPQNKEDVLCARALTAIWLLLRHVPKGNHDIGRIDIEGSYNGRAGVFVCKPISFGMNFSFYLAECHQRVLLSFEDRKVQDLLDANSVPIEFYCEKTAENEKRMVLELINNPASRFASDMIQKAISLEDFLIHS